MKKVRDFVAQAIVQILKEEDGLATNELFKKVSEQYDYSQAAFYRALKDLKSDNIVVGISEGGRTTNHLKDANVSLVPSGRRSKFSHGLRSVIESSALALIEDALNESSLADQEDQKTFHDRAASLYSAIVAYEESKGIRYKRPWKDGANLDEVPRSDWIRFFGYVVGNVCDDNDD